VEVYSRFMWGQEQGCKYVVLSANSVLSIDMRIELNKSTCLNFISDLLDLDLIPFCHNPR
jgi:hypothetical protein